MQRSTFGTWLGSVAATVLAAGILVSPVFADKDNVQDRKKNRPSDEPSAWSEPVVSGTVMQTMWVDSKDPGSFTAAMIVWSNDSDLAVTIYGDDPSVRQAIVDNVACAGRYVVVGGDRLEAEEMIGRSIEVHNLETPCTSTLQPR